MESEKASLLLLRVVLSSEELINTPQLSIQIIKITSKKYYHFIIYQNFLCIYCIYMYVFLCNII